MKKKVLFADDVDHFLTTGKACFQEEDFMVYLARNGDEALSICRSVKPDIAFLDLNMPIVSGAACCARLKGSEQFGGLPVIMMLTGMSEYDMKRCRDAKCDETMEKPINRQKAQDIVRRYLNLRNRQTIRYEARLQVRYGTVQNQLLTDYSINLSTGGLFLETPDPFPEGTALTTEFALPGSKGVVKCRARVAWVNHPDYIVRPQLDSGMGLQFLDLSLADMDSIREYIRDNTLTPAW